MEAGGGRLGSSDASQHEQVNMLVGHLKSVDRASISGRLSDVQIISNSADSSYSDYKSSEGGALWKCWRALFNYRHAEEYFKALILTLIVNLLCFMINLLQAFLIRPDKGKKWSNQNTLAVISLISGLLAILNCIIVISLLVRPRTAGASLSFSLIASQLVLYVCEVTVYYQPDPAVIDDDWSGDTSSVVISSVVTILLFCVQCLTALAMWRHWEFLKYNYDGSTAISLRSSLLLGDSGVYPRDSLVTGDTRDKDMDMDMDKDKEDGQGVGGYDLQTQAREPFPLA